MAQKKLLRFAQIKEFENVHEYPEGMKAQQIVAAGGSCIAFFVTVYWSLRAATALLGLLGPLKVTSCMAEDHRQQLSSLYWQQGHTGVK